MPGASWREPAPVAVLREQRCRACRRLLCKTDERSRVEVVCPKCKTLNLIRPKYPS